MAHEREQPSAGLHQQLTRLLSHEQCRRQERGGEPRLSCLERLAICRHSQRPKPVQLLQAIGQQLQQLHGDRLIGDDPALWSGMATIAGVRCVVLASNKGSTTEERLACRFGMMNPEGYRKAQRIMKLAERFQLPVISLVDTAGAYSGLEAEERGQGWAIAETLALMSRLRTPILSVITGEGCSGGALGLAVADWMACYEHAYFSVISPEGCSSILWRDGAAVGKAAETLKMQSEHLLDLRVIDQILPEGFGGGHLHPKAMAEVLQEALQGQLERLKRMPLDALVERRQHRYRTLQFEPVG
jgi:acetyl-CoA carboxylase carboxyl transferase subunit alpha